MLSPFPKSTVISSGTPRKACITRRWTFSFTGDILEQLTDRLRSVHVVLRQDLRKTSSEICGQIVQRFEQRLEKLLCARTGHRELSSARKKVEMLLKSTKNSCPASTVTMIQRQTALGIRTMDSGN